MTLAAGIAMKMRPAAKVVDAVRSVAIALQQIVIATSAKNVAPMRKQQCQGWN